MEVQPDDLLEAAAACRSVLEPLVEHDWAVTAGDLSWDVRTTITHVCDAVGWYAAHLAAQSRGRLRFDFHAHDNASNAELLDVFDAAAATLAQVARAAPAGARAYHNAGMADGCGFLAMGCDETLVHGWDAIRGLGGEFAGLRPTWRRGCLAGFFPGHLLTRPRGRRCCGLMAGSTFSGGFRVSGRIGSGIARLSTSGTVLSRMRSRIHPPATNGLMAAVAGVHARDASPSSFHDGEA